MAVVFQRPPTRWGIRFAMVSMDNQVNVLSMVLSHEIWNPTWYQQLVVYLPLGDIWNQILWQVVTLALHFFPSTRPWLKENNRREKGKEKRKGSPGLFCPDLKTARLQVSFLLKSCDGRRDGGMGGWQGKMVQQFSTDNPWSFTARSSTDCLKISLQAFWNTLYSQFLPSLVGELCNRH